MLNRLLLNGNAICWAYQHLRQQATAGLTGELSGLVDAAFQRASQPAMSSWHLWHAPVSTPCAAQHLINASTSNAAMSLVRACRIPSLTLVGRHSQREFVALRMLGVVASSGSEYLESSKAASLFWLARILAALSLSFCLRASFLRSRPNVDRAIGRVGARLWQEASAA